LRARRSDGALIFRRDVGDDLAAENRHVTRRFDAETDASAIAREHDDAYAVADQNRVAGLPT